jgi:hypothetical protein
MELIALPDLDAFVGDTDFAEQFESYDEDWYHSCSNINGYLSAHRRSLEILAAIKPRFSVAGLASDYSACSHEMLPSGTAQLIDFIDAESELRDGIKPSCGFRLVDIGFGAGGVLLAASMYTHHRGWLVSGVERDQRLVQVFHDWLTRITTLCPGMASIAHELKSNWILGEVKSVSCEATVQLCLREANAVFVNNLLFQDLRGRRAMSSLNGVIGEMLCACDVGTLVVTTAFIGARVENRQLELKRRVKWNRQSFSWTDGEVEGYIFEVVAC